MTEYPMPTPPSTALPSASEFTSSPLRNRLRVELDAPVSEVWELMGDLSRYPEYSAGLERVEAKTDEDGRCIEYTCYFKPLENGAEGAVSRDVMKWYEPNRGVPVGRGRRHVGWRRRGRPPDARSDPGGTRVTNDMHFESEDLEAAKAHIDEALVDIAANLVARFGGRLTERYVEE